MSFMTNIKNIFGGRIEVSERLAENQFAAEATRFAIVNSEPAGDFVFYISDQAARFLDEQFCVKIDDLKKISQRIYNRCKKFGWVPSATMHFSLEFQTARHPREGGLMTSKIEPPIPLQSGASITRGILLFRPNILQGVAATKKEIASMGSEVMRVVGGMIPTILQIKYKTILAHELVHIFATDEFDKERGMLELLGLDLLELLTDSITLDEFHADYSSNPFEELGFMEGVGYLTNVVGHATVGSFGPGSIKEMHRRAKKIIRECQEKLNETQCISKFTKKSVRDL